jgi:hypothetical protein
MNFVFILLLMVLMAGVQVYVFGDGDSGSVQYADNVIGRKIYGGQVPTCP